MVIMLSLSKFWQISYRCASNKVEDLGIALRIKVPSCQVSKPVTKQRKLKQKENSRLQHIEGVRNSSNSISIVRNSVPNRRNLSIILLPTLLLFAACGMLQCYSHKMPQNVAQRIGERVVMSCAFSETVHPCQNMVWTHYTAHALVSNIIWMENNISRLVSHYISIVDLNDGKCNLDIKTQTSAEGKYECLSTMTGQKESALLIILADYPECLIKTVVNERGEYSNITCSVEYFGDWAPTMEWIMMNEQNSTIINSYLSYPSDQIVSTSLVLPQNASSRYKCILKFTEQGRKTNTTATNVPHYEWASLFFGTTWEKETEVESTTEGVNQVSCDGHRTLIIIACGGFCIALTCIIVFIFIGILLTVGVIMYKRRMERNGEMHHPPPGKKYIATGDLDLPMFPERHMLKGNLKLVSLRPHISVKSSSL